jgi:hypothetical protein
MAENNEKNQRIAAKWNSVIMKFQNICSAMKISHSLHFLWETNSPTSWWRVS